MWGLVAIAGIAWLAYTTYLEHQRKTGRGERSPESLSALEARIDAGEAERDRLRARIETLEAILTDDGFDLEREARRAGLAGDPIGTPTTRLDLDALGGAADDPTGSSSRGRTRA